VLATFAIASPALLFAPTTFGHVTAGTLGFSAFLLAWNRRPLAAGLAAGAAVLVEYQAGLIVLIIAAYVALAGGRSLARYLGGLVPAAVTLGAYNQAAFGSPLHLSYRYVSRLFSADQGSGFFGVGAPHGHAVYETLAGSGGLLVVMPVSAAAAAGLVVLARTRPVEAAVCALVTVAFLLLEFSYFLPYGGTPVPRFLIPALPFLLVGLGAAFVRAPRLTAALSAASAIPLVALLLTWASGSGVSLEAPQGIWGDLARLPVRGTSSPLINATTKNILTLWTGQSRVYGTELIVVLAALVWVVGVLPALRARSPERIPAPPA
jgi:hypothetical protein